MPPELIAKLKEMGLKEGATEAEIKAFMKENNVQWIQASKSLKPIEGNGEGNGEGEGKTAPIQAAAPAAPATPATVDPNQAAILASRAENTRISAINALESDAENAAEIRAAGIDAGQTVDQVELALLRAARPSSFNINTHHTPVNAQVIEASIQLGASPVGIVEANYSDEILTAASARPISSITGAIRAICAMRGVHLPHNPTENEIMQAAASSADVSNILGNTVRATLETAYNLYPGVADVMRLCAIENVPNFKEKKFLRLHTDGKTSEVGDSGKLEHGYLQDEAKGVQISTKGKLIEISRKMMINDELGAFLALPQLISQDSAQTFIADFWTLFTSNLNTFFSIDHKNVYDNADGVNAANYKQMTKIFRTQKDDAKRPMAISPRYVIVSPDEEDAAITMAQSRNMMVVDRKSNATISSVKGDVNIYSKYEPVVCPWLEGTTFYGLADPRMLAAFVAAFLHGKKTPTVANVTNRLPADVLPGAAWTVHFDYGFAQKNFRAAARIGS